MITFITRNKKGFTLIELIVVLAVFSILSVVVMPRIMNYLSSTRDNFLLLTTTIKKTFDDAFINQHTNFLILHCDNKESEVSDISSSIFERSNAISVAILDEKSEFIDSKNKLLKFRQFPDSFSIKEVLLTDGTIYTTGNIFIPFYPSGFSSSAIIHILINNEEEWSVIINPYLREPTVIKGYSTYEEIK